MNSDERRIFIKKLLIESDNPIKGSQLAQRFNLTRQVIVKDIALLRAAGVNIIATPEGYIIPESSNKNIKRVIAVNHKKEEAEEELKIIIKYGGIVEDVIIEHPLYGEIRAMLMIKNLYDVENFIKNYRKFDTKPLSSLTGGVHLHTIRVDKEENMNNILEELTEKNFRIIE